MAWAHRNLAHFPDGQLAVDLRGFSPGEPRDAADVLGDFLAALGVDRDHHPADLDARAALYRTHTTGKRKLILLDNAAAPDQVVPLLPGGDTCTVLITSRDRLRSLIARHSAHPVRVDVLTDDEARTLLAAALDDNTPESERLITELVGLCGGLPLALGLIAARIRTHPALLGDLVTELRDFGLGALDSADPDASLPTVLSWSLHHLTDEQRTLFGLLGIAPGLDTTLPAVAALMARSPDRTRAALSALAEASLIEHRPLGRYVMHDLVRDYAATTDLPDELRARATARAMDFYLHTAHTADRLLAPYRPLLRPDPPVDGVRPHALPDAAAATAWLAAEQANLLATQRAAVALGRHHVVWYLAWALDTFLIRQGARRDALDAWRAALEAAAHLPDPAARIHTHQLLGRVCSRLNLHEEATEHLDQALVLAVRQHDAAEQAHTHQVLAADWGRRGDNRRPWTTPCAPSTSTELSTSRIGRPTRSTRWAGSPRAWVTSTPRASTARPRSPRTSTTTTTTAKRPPWTAWGSSPTAPATTGEPSSTTTARSPCSGQTARATRSQALSTTWATPMPRSDNTRRRARFGGRHCGCTGNRAVTLTWSGFSASSISSRPRWTCTVAAQARRDVVLNGGACSHRDHAVRRARGHPARTAGWRVGVGRGGDGAPGFQRRGWPRSSRLPARSTR
ncbi:NB-ARC domain-containing protein [Actinokineospora diospyrosa]|uniref:NB-ARC domain-containing protein n=1 Tax=Actinokineospora diospyrosa TaxID=103728 RepID=A0ABT1IFW5_9PSEU|nr:NB-ARC domain-containing protein [Actinokineospora diospyrosa]